ncbi:MAG: hypothetical protein AAF234_18250 [Pseudomonadota bacterium]
MLEQSQTKVERAILIFTIWASLGFLGLGVFLEGMARDLWALSAVGVSVIVATLVAHIIVNAVFKTGMSRGEATLGIGLYGFLGLVFIASTIGGGMTPADYYAGLTLFGTLAVGFLVYLVARHGLRGAFSHFHHHREMQSNDS